MKWEKIERKKRPKEQHDAVGEESIEEEKKDERARRRISIWSVRGGKSGEEIEDAQ